MMDSKPEIASLLRPSRRSRFRRYLSAWVTGISAAAAIVAVFALLSVLVYILIGGIGAISLDTFTQGPVPEGQPGGGLRNGIVGTLILMSIASAIGLPIGILGGVYQLETNTRFSRTLRFFTDVMNSIPSIVMGIFAYLIVVLPVAELYPGHADHGEYPTLSPYRASGRFARTWCDPLAHDLERGSASRTRRYCHRNIARARPHRR
jgi:ABC-type phosphate transport system permease subunit